MKNDIKNVFPLKVIAYDFDYGMGEQDIRYRLETNDGKVICHSDYMPDNIDYINEVVNKFIE